MKDKISKILAVLKGLWAKDAYQRQMTWAFFASALTLVALVLFHKQIFPEIVDPRTRASDRPGESVQNEKDAEHAKHGYPTALISAISIEIAPATKGKKTEPSYLVQLEFSVECEEESTCKFIEKSQVPLRDQVLLILNGLDRYHFLSKEGKERVRRTLLQQLNAWLPSGKLHNLYITQLVIS